MNNIINIYNLENIINMENSKIELTSFLFTVRNKFYYYHLTTEYLYSKI